MATNVIDSIIRTTMYSMDISEIAINAAMNKKESRTLIRMKMKMLDHFSYGWDIHRWCQYPFLLEPHNKDLRTIRCLKIE